MIVPLNNAANWTNPAMAEDAAAGRFAQDLTTLVARFEAGGLPLKVIVAELLAQVGVLADELPDPPTCWPRAA